MDDYFGQLQLLADLDERHDELLRELEELEKQIESVLALWTTERETRRSAA